MDREKRQLLVMQSLNHWVRLIFIGFALSWPCIVHPQASSPGNRVPASFCLTSPSFQLSVMINNYRHDHSLPGIPLSKSLCFIAELHAKDLIYHKPAVGGCGFHSWSDKGRWTPCCFSRENPVYICMWNKPKELTTYKGKGYEIIYWENDSIEPEQALNQWKNQPLFNEMILHKGSWSKKVWKAIGVALYEGYAIIWLGEESDVVGEPDLCDELSVSQSDTTKGQVPGTEPPAYMTDVRYYLVAASLTTREKADQVLLEYKQKGFVTAMIITFDNKIRISLNDFPTYYLAKKAKNSLGADYQNVWILER